MFSTNFLVRMVVSFLLGLVLPHFLKTDIYQSMTLAFFIGTTVGFFPT